VLLVLVLVDVALVVVAVGEYVKVLVATPETEPHTYVAFTRYVPDTQFGPPVTKWRE